MPYREIITIPSVKNVQNLNVTASVYVCVYVCVCVLTVVLYEGLN